MDSEHRTLLERVAKSLETLAAPPQDQVAKTAELEAKLAAAEDNWRGRHKRACEAEAQLVTKRQQSIVSHEDISFWKFQSTEKADALRLKNEEYARLDATCHRQSRQIDRLSQEHDAMLDRVQAAEKRERALQRTVDELTKSDFGKLHAKYEGGLARLRKRIVVLNSRVGYWKRKKS